MAALQCELCGGKLIGKPGGVFECDSCGMEYSTEWAKAKIQEIKGTVKVEGTVQVEGTVKVEGGINIESLLKRGQIALEAKEWAQAKKFFDEAMNLNVDCAEACLGFLLSEQKCSNINELVKKRTQVNYDYSQIDEVPPGVVVMPKDGITVESCIMGEWNFNVGDTVNVGDELFTYETDKAEFGCHSTVAGTLVDKFYEHGDEVRCLVPVAWILPNASGTDISVDSETNKLYGHIVHMVKQYSIENHFTPSQIRSYYRTEEISRFDADVVIIKNRIQTENEFWTKNNEVAHILSIDTEGSLHQAREKILARLRQQLEEKKDRKKEEYENIIRIADQRVVEAYRAVLEKKQVEEEAKQKKLEDKMRKDAELVRQEAERKAKRAIDLNAEKSTLTTELSNLKGLFSGKRRKEIEARLEAIERELKGL